MTQEILLATLNTGKVAEFQSLLQPLSWQVRSQSDFNLAAAQETGLTFVENALLKARHGAQATGLATLADDSGLVVDALNGAPGIYSARYAGIDSDAAANNAKLLSDMAEVPDSQRSAHFVCVIAYLRHATDPEPLIAKAEWHGYLLHSAQGQAGFGYDPLFYLPEHGCSAAELDSKRKNQLSHRGQAMAQLLQGLSDCCR